MHTDQLSSSNILYKACVNARPQNMGTLGTKTSKEKKKKKSKTLCKFEYYLEFEWEY